MAGEVSVELGSRHRLTPSQELIWTSQRVAPLAPLANMATLSRFGGDIDPDRLIDAFHQVVLATPVLRRTVRPSSGRPFIETLAAPPADTAVVELASEELHQWCYERIAKPLDTAVAGYDSVLLHLDGESWAWWLNLHHLFTDAASSALVYQATAAFYAGDTPDIGDYDAVAAAQLESRTTPRWERADEHWRSAAVQSHPDTVFYRPDRGEDTRAERAVVDLNPQRLADLRELLAGPFRALTDDLGLLITIATVLGVYLHRLGNTEPIRIGVPVHHRSGREAKSAIGPLVELFPVEFTVNPDDTFATVHKRISRAVLDVLKVAQPGTAPRQSFDVVLNVHAATFGAFAGIPTTTVWVPSGHIDAHHRLRAQVLDYTGDGDLRFEFDINHRIASAAQRARAPRHVEAVLDAMLADVDAPVNGVVLLTPEETSVLQTYNGPGTNLAPVGVDLPVTPVISQVMPKLLAAAERTVVSHAGHREVSGAELHDMVERTARWLRAQGVGAGDRVGIEFAPSVGAVVAILGVHRAGASFVPIDPEYPPTRRDHIRADAGITVTLDQATLDRLDNLKTAAALADPAELPLPSLDDEAYVIYTSGSTGLPKGVPITHRGLADYLRFAMGSYVPANSAPVVPLFSSLSFDLTVTSLFLPLLAEGTMTVHPAGGITALGEIANEGRATWLKATPSHLELLVRMVDADHPLRTLVVGGEAFSRGLAERLRAALGDDAALFNEYGPTEAVVGIMIHRYDHTADTSAQVPIGVPAPEAEIHLLDPAGNPVPLGVTGEMYLHRPSMFTGYLNAPEQTAEKLVSLPQVSPHVLYRTGDLARMLDDSTMVYQGRSDDQLKVGGVRIEPAEIEQAALTHPTVQRAFVRVWSPDTSTAPLNCVRCGMPSDVPGITFDEALVCSTCHDFDRVEPQAESWFRTVDDLRDEIAAVRARATGDFDVVHLLSGGKDSTYALYRLVELGARVFALTLDNGYISDGAKANVDSAVADLGITHEYATTEAMADIFRDSLERFSNVCNGCYKTIYTMGINRADEIGAPAVVTGLSRGQFFETRLVPALFTEEAFNPDAIDEMVLEARKAYHRTDDTVQQNLDTTRFESDDIFDRVGFIDFYRYVDVPLSEMFTYLETKTKWQRPPDTGRSTNCLINSAGIYVHRMEQGHHNYALPYSWDVKLGHKTRDEAMEELDDPMDDEEMAAITRMLAEVGYQPRRPELLTLWFEPVAGEQAPTSAELRTHLEGLVPDHGLPNAYVELQELPVTVNGKVDEAALAPPTRRSRVLSASGRAPESPTELLVAEVWAELLGLDSLSVDDDFFALGGTSLEALEMVVLVSRRVGTELPEVIVFQNRTIAQVSAAIDSLRHDTPDRAGGEGGGAARETGGETATGEPETAMSIGEEALVYEWRSDPGATNYGGGQWVVLPPGLEQAAVEAALGEVVAHQPTLHTAYDRARTPLAVSQALRVDTVHGQGSFNEIAAELNRAPFDLINGPLVTAHFVTTDQIDQAGQTALVVRAHHISADASSMAVLWAQLEVALQGETLPPLDMTFAQHAMAQRARVTDASRSFWNTTFAAQPAELALPRDPRAPGDASHHTALHRPLDEIVGANRSALAPALAATVLAVAPFHDGDIVEVGLTASLRDRPEVANTVGYFTNVLPLRIPVPAEPRFDELAATIDSLVIEAIGHRSVPFATMVREARAAGLPEPQARIIVAWNEVGSTTLDGEPVAPQPVPSAGAVGDLAFIFTASDNAVAVELESRAGLLDDTRANALLHHITDQMDRAASDPTAVVEPPPLAVIDGARLAPATTTVAHQVHAAALANADRAAVRCGASSLSYGEVNSAAASLAHALRDAGVQNGHRVAVSAARTHLLPVAIRAIWHLGASYVPIDPEQPGPRIAELARSVDATVLLTGASHNTLSADDLATIDLASACSMAGDPLDAPAAVAPSDEAYVIFTSGTTGLPKAVPVTHANLAASNGARLAFYPDAVERYLLVSKASFDSSIAGLFWTMAQGGELVIPTDDQVHDIDALLALIDEAQPTHVLCVPSLYGAMLTRRDSALASLRVIVVAGEAALPAVVSRHHELAEPTTWLVNEYGPSEATVWATAHRCLPTDDFATVPIGTPIAAVRAIVADSRQQPLGVGAAGELLLSGPSVTRGYVDRPDETAASFVTLADGSLAYRTGDRVTAGPDGVLEFLGRIDHQLSIGGVRVEPGEIEAVIAEVDGVEEVAVVAVGRRLVAVLAPATSDDEARENVVRDVVAQRLPTTLHPARYHSVTTLARTPNGKIDRAALAELPELTAPPPAPAEEATAVGRGRLGAVVNIFCAVFEDTTLDADDDFFDLGGDSLQAVELVMAIEDRTGFRVGIGELADLRTPRAIAGRTLESTSGTKSQPAATSSDPNIMLAQWMRTGADRAPLVIIGALGDVFGYIPLIDNLDPDLPVLGLGMPVDASGNPLPTIEAQAAALHQELLTHLPAGPYRLLGWSAGGLLAWEMSELLRTDGHDVELVVLVDTYALPVTETSTSAVELTPRQRATEAARRLTGGVRRARDFSRRNATWSVRQALELRRQREAFWARARNIAERYRPSPLRPATEASPQPKVLFVGAEGSHPELTVDVWRELHPGLEICMVPGIHVGNTDDFFLSRARVSTVAGAVADALDH